MVAVATVWGGCGTAAIVAMAIVVRAEGVMGIVKMLAVILELWS